MYIVYCLRASEVRHFIHFSYNISPGVSKAPFLRVRGSILLYTLSILAGGGGGTLASGTVGNLYTHAALKTWCEDGRQQSNNERQKRGRVARRRGGRQTFTFKAKGLLVLGYITGVGQQQRGSNEKRYCNERLSFRPPSALQKTQA